MLHNHWGIMLDTEKPTTTVYSGNAINWEYMPEPIFLDAPEDEDAELDTTCQLYGDWAQGDDGLWGADHDGAMGFAAIYDSNDNYLQVVWSRRTARGRMCSPCFPGQVDADTISEDGKQTCYVLPKELLYAQD